MRKFASLFEPKVVVVRKVSFPCRAEFIRQKLETEHSEKDNVWKMMFVLTSLIIHPTMAYADTAKTTDNWHNLYAKLSVAVEPIFVFVFVYGFIMFALNQKSKGENVIKGAALAYIGITILPAGLAFLRWLGSSLSSMFNSGGMGV